MARKRILIILALLVVPILLFLVFYLDRIYPGVYIAGNSVGGKTADETITVLKNITPPKELNIQDFKIPLESLGFSYNIDSTINKAERVGRSGNILFDISQIINSIIHKTNYGLDINLDEDKLNQKLSIIAGQIAIDPVYPSIVYKNNQVTILKGKPGIDVDTQKLRLDIGQALSKNQISTISIPTKAVDPTLSDQEAVALKQKAEKLIGKKITINFDNKNLELTTKDIIPLLGFKSTVNDEEVQKLIEKLSKEFERAPQDASFIFDNGVVKEFTPDESGIKIKTDELKTNMENALNILLTDQKETALTIPANLTSAKIKTADVNNLGLKELIGRGTSLFAGSISSRIHNVNVASRKLNGHLVAPGETFSFNDAIGDISVYTGYQQAYIIQGGKTVLGDGGGVCQVSTTMFRAAMNAGLPIVERNAHAYRVHYYEEDMPPGVDATVFSPTVDFKFKNDTPGYILIQTQVDLVNLKLTFDIYGTKDGRVATVSRPIISNVTPAPAPLYTDDPSLPTGVIKQIDFSAPGTQSKFDYKVEKDGQVIYQKTFYSNYRPWQAKFLVGTGA